MAHTPGPWKSGKWKAPHGVDLSGWIDIWATDEDGEETLPFAACKHIDQEANARLIAAAPDLLEALQSIAECCEEDQTARDYASRQTEIRGIARAAIAKATGGQ